MILEKVNKNLVKSLKVNQWRNSESVINWFNAVENKFQCFFIQLDIVKFYPSISETILDTAINLAKQYTDIFDENLRIIKHCRKSLLYNNHELWKKKDTDSCFDVAIGSYDGAEVCGLVGIYLLSLLANIIDKNNSGLYRNDGLIFLCNVNEQKMDRVKMSVIKMFKEDDFKIEIQTHLKIIDVLDVTFNLANGTYRPYKKADESLLYISTSSTHPPQVIKELLASINEWVSNNSSSEKIFSASKY